MLRFSPVPLSFSCGWPNWFLNGFLLTGSKGATLAPWGEGDNGLSSLGTWVVLLTGEMGLGARARGSTWAGGNTLTGVSWRGLTYIITHTFLQFRSVLYMYILTSFCWPSLATWRIRGLMGGRIAGFGSGCGGGERTAIEQSQQLVTMTR